MLPRAKQVAGGTARAAPARKVLQSQRHSATRTGLAMNRVRALVSHLSAPAPAAAAAVQSPSLLSDTEGLPRPIENIVVRREHPAIDAPVAEKVDYFRECGYVKVEGALCGEDLRRTQDEFTAGAEQMRPLWEAAKTGAELRIDGHLMKNVPTEWFDIPKYAELGPASLALCHLPKNIEILTELVGADMALSQIQARTLPPQSEEFTLAKGGYAGWHRDQPMPFYEHSQRSLRAKCFVYLWDTPADCGCTAVVPGSHRWNFSAGDDFYKGKYAGPRMEDMPGHQRAAVKAGTAMIFDLR